MKYVCVICDLEQEGCPEPSRAEPTRANGLSRPRLGRVRTQGHTCALSLPVMSEASTSDFISTSTSTLTDNIYHQLRAPLSHNTTATSLPQYIRQQPAPPPYNPPATLLSPVWLKQHLLLLALFSQLKTTIESLDLGSPVNEPNDEIRDTQSCLRDLDERGRWGVFVEMAVRRFGMWQAKYVAEGVEDLPPLDVLMVWCAYLGSPRWCVFSNPS